MRIGLRALVLSLPLIVILMLFFMAVLTLLPLSMYTFVPGPKLWRPDLTVGNYVDFFSTPFYISSLLLTIRLAIEATLVSLVLGYSLAYSIARTQSKMFRRFLFIVVIGSIFISGVVRSFSWIIILGSNGVVNQMLQSLGLTSAPIPLMGNEFGVVIGVAHYALPYVILSLIPSIQKIAPEVEDASRSMGASNMRTMSRVIIPLSVPGLLTATILGLSISLAAYVTPVILGGGKVQVLPVLIYNAFGTFYSANLPLAAAMSVILLAISVVILMGISKIIQSFFKGSFG